MESFYDIKTHSVLVYWKNREHLTEIRQWVQDSVYEPESNEHLYYDLTYIDWDSQRVQYNFRFKSDAAHFKLRFG